MTYFECKRQTKPFIDQNLQFQHPDWDIPPAQSSYSPIYTHYIGSSTSYLPLEVNEADLYEAMKEAEDSYKAWKRLERQLQEKRHHPLA